MVPMVEFVYMPRLRMNLNVVKSQPCTPFSKSSSRWSGLSSLEARGNAKHPPRPCTTEQYFSHVPSASQCHATTSKRTM